MIHQFLRQKENFNDYYDESKMKVTRLLIVIFLITLTVFVNAQNKIAEYKPFRVYTSIGYAADLHFLSGGPAVGISFSNELAYNISRKIFIGVNLETGSVRIASTDEIYSSDIGTIVTSFNFYLDERLNRWFIGGGAGLFFLGSLPAEQKAGLMARGGVDRHHLHMAVELNYAGKSSYAVSNSYMSFKIGIAIGGGKRK